MTAYTNHSPSDIWPKTLEIRNTPDGMIWQIYHVNNASEAELLSRNARSNAFMDRRLTDYQPEQDETFEGWREDPVSRTLLDRAQEMEKDLRDAE
jgi:hypothetical protein